MYRKTIVSSRGAIVCSHDGTASAGRWLSFGGNPSNTSPYIQPEPGSLRAVSLSTQGASTVTIVLYKNGVSVATFNLVGSAALIDNTLSIPLDPSDTLSAQVTSGSAIRPSLFLFVQM